MEAIISRVKPHSHFLDALFTYRSKVNGIFNDVLGLHEIHHIAVSCLNVKNELLTFSSTPALEFNLFNSALWQFDATYHYQWIQHYSQVHWESLYCPARYDELYYLKQIKPRYPLGISLAAQIEDLDVIYCLASRNSAPEVRELYATLHDNFYKIGQYCTELLLPYFAHCDPVLMNNPTVKAIYESSN